MEPMEPMEPTSKPLAMSPADRNGPAVVRSRRSAGRGHVIRGRPLPVSRSSPSRTDSLFVRRWGGAFAKLAVYFALMFVRLGATVIVGLVFLAWLAFIVLFALINPPAGADDPYLSQAWNEVIATVMLIVVFFVIARTGGLDRFNGWLESVHERGTETIARLDAYQRGETQDSPRRT